MLRAPKFDSIKLMELHAGDTGAEDSGGGAEADSGDDESGDDSD